MASRIVPKIPMREFGKDHWSTFAYIETCCVDHRGRVSNERMRCDPKRHPDKGHPYSFVTVVSEGKYPTILRGGVKRHDHDDWDCVDDLEAAGLLGNDGTGTQPRFVLTPLGEDVAARLRRHKATGGSFSTFTVTGDDVPTNSNVQEATK